jgi:hypothetical protein
MTSFQNMPVRRKPFRKSWTKKILPRLQKPLYLAWLPAEWTAIFRERSKKQIVE